MDFRRLQDGKWYDYPEYKGARLKIRPLSRKDTVECLANAKTDKRETADPGLFIWENFKRALQSWEGFDIPEGKKHLRDEIIESFFEDEKLVDFVLIRSSASFKEETEKIEAELKNSESSQPG